MRRKEEVRLYYVGDGDADDHYKNTAATTDDDNDCDYR